MHIQIKGKGALILAIGFLPFIIISVLASGTIHLFGIEIAPAFNMPLFQLLGGISLLVSAAINHFIPPDYEIDKYGDRNEVPGEFMWISVRVWTYIFLFMGIINSLEPLFKIYHILTI